VGIKLDLAGKPVAAYVPAVRTGNYVFTSGQLPSPSLAAALARFEQLEPTLLVHARSYVHGGREHDRTEVIRELRDKLPTLKATIDVSKEVWHAATTRAADLAPAPRRGPSRPARHGR
jgi:hypothetical protein